MRMIACDIGNSGELHKLYVEYCRDKGLRIPKPDMWLWLFRDPSFFCIMFKHGRKPSAFLMGQAHRFYEEPVAEITTVFMRRALRGKIRSTRKIIKASKDYLRNALNIRVLAYTKAKSRERKL